MFVKLKYCVCIAAVFLTVAMPLQAADIARPKIDGQRVLLDIPQGAFAREYLLSACVAKTDHYQWMEVGTRPSTLHVRFERIGGAVWLRRVNTAVVGNPTDTLCSLSATTIWMAICYSCR